MGGPQLSCIAAFEGRTQLVLLRRTKKNSILVTHGPFTDGPTVEMNYLRGKFSLQPCPTRALFVAVAKREEALMVGWSGAVPDAA